MLLEFGSYLKLAWRRSVVVALSGDVSKTQIDRFLTLKQLELPGSGFSSDAATPFCFKLAKDIGVAADTLADSFVSATRNLFGNQCEVSVGGGGYLNCSFKEALPLEFISSFATCSIEDFLQGIPITAPEVFGSDRPPFFKLDPPKVSYEQLVSRIGATFVDSEQFLNVLLSVGDREIDPLVALGGAKSRQNFNWYNDQFSYDLGRFQAIIGKIEPIRDLSRSDRWHSERLFLPMLDSVRRIRHSFLLSLATGHPELAVVECRNLIDRFYSVFNHPSVRNLGVLKLGENDLKMFGEFISRYGELVASALRLATGAINR